MSETEAKVQQIKDKAYKEGFEEGRMQGMQQRYDEAEPLAQQGNKILEQLDSLRKIVRFQAEEELVKLALQISKNIVVSSAVNILEIWDKELYENSIDDAKIDFGNLAEEVMGDKNDKNVS